MNDLKLTLPASTREKLSQLAAERSSPGISFDADDEVRLAVSEHLKANKAKLDRIAAKAEKDEIQRVREQERAYRASIAVGKAQGPS